MNKFLSHLEKRAGTGKIGKALDSAGEGVRRYVGHLTGRNVRRAEEAVNLASQASRPGLQRNVATEKIYRMAALSQVGAAVGGAAVGAAGVKAYSDHEKKAALEQLLQHGFDFDAAVEAIEKEAGFGAVKGMANMVAGKAKSFATAVKADATKLPGQAKSVMTGKTTLQGTRFKTNVSIPRTTALKEMVGNRASIAAAGGAGLGAAMASRNKKDA